MLPGDRPGESANEDELPDIDQTQFAMKFSIKPGEPQPDVVKQY